MIIFVSSLPSYFAPCSLVSPHPYCHHRPSIFDCTPSYKRFMQTVQTEQPSTGKAPLTSSSCILTGRYWLTEPRWRTVSNGLSPVSCPTLSQHINLLLSNILMIATILYLISTFLSRSLRDNNPFLTMTIQSFLKPSSPQPESTSTSVLHLPHHKRRRQIQQQEKTC